MLGKQHSKKPLVNQHQIFSVFIFLSNSLCYYFCTTELICARLKAYSFYFYICLSVIFVTITIFAMSSNPRDAILKKEMMKRKRVDKRQHCSYSLNIISNCSFCTICCSNINRRSRHCRQCNFCTEGFDHHCKWINNCIGKENYCYFFSLLIITYIILTYVAVIDFIILICIESFEDNLAVSITSTLFCVIDGVCSMNVLGLIIFHIWLKCKGITTFDYLTIKRRKERERKNEAEKEYKGAKEIVNQIKIVSVFKDKGKIANANVKANANIKENVNGISISNIMFQSNSIRKIPQYRISNSNNNSMEFIINNNGSNRKG